jgi:hypothetical protein
MMACLNRILSTLAVLSCLLTPAASAQEQLPAARLSFTGTTFGLLLGYSQGRGTLNFNGEEFPFAVRGFKLLTLGAAKVEAEGVVYNLQKLADFAGSYAAAEGDVTLFIGGGVTVMKNQHGVVIYLQNLQRGLELTAGGGNLQIALEQPTAEREENPAATASPAK